MDKTQAQPGGIVHTGRATADRITLNGVGAVGYHGVFDQEKKVGQPFFADVTLYTDVRRAGETDDLEHTVNYGEVAELVKDVIMGESVDLLETLATTMADRVLSRFPVDAVELTVHKPKAPIDVTFSDVSVTIYRERS